MEGTLAWRRGGVGARWLGGCLLVDSPYGAVLVDATLEGARALRSDEGASRLCAVVLSSDRTRSIEGLIGVLAAAADAGASAVQLVTPLTAERGVALAQAWITHWGRLALELDAVAPGSVADTAVGTVSMAPLHVGEPTWSPPAVHAVPGAGVALEVAGETVAWLPSARPGHAARQAAAGASLAVVEVGVLPFPPTPHPWRRSVSEALRLGALAERHWLVGDDGRAVDTGPAH